MDLSEFILLDEEHTLSPDDAQALNLDLSAKISSGIPKSYRQRVADYLLAALNMNSIDPNLVPNIEKLLHDLHKDN